MKEAKYDLYKNFTSAIFGISDWISSNRVNDFMNEYQEKETRLLKKETKIKIFVHFRENLVNFIAGLTVFYMIYSCWNMTLNDSVENVYICLLYTSTGDVLESRYEDYKLLFKEKETQKKKYIKEK